jgi:hypothetical protein
VASWEDVRSLALALPETEERLRHGTPTWFVREKAFAWDRPLRRSDLEALGPDAPAGPVLCVYVEHLEAKAAVLAGSGGVYFTTPHFDRSRMVLIRLEEIEEAELEEALTEAWLVRAPRRLADAWVRARAGEFEQ